MHGQRVPMGGRLAKAYLVTLFDDASRLVAHSAFCPGETALDIECVLKQALLKQFLSELDERLMTSLDDLNARLWA